MKTLNEYKKYERYLTLEKKVNNLTKIIQYNTLGLNIDINNKAFEELVKIGKDIIPYVIENIKDTRNYSIAWSLYEITNLEPYKGIKTKEEYINSWINWYNDDYYIWLTNKDYQKNDNENLIRERITFLGDIIRDLYIHPDSKLNSKEYYEIIKLGNYAIPYLIDDFRNKKYHSWGSALCDITGLRPLKKSEGFQGSIDAWIEWYEIHYENWIKK